MYSVNSDVAELWRNLVAWVSSESGVVLDYVDYPAPRPLGALWSRPDIGLVQMCGWPFRQSVPRPQLIAAPVIDDDHTGGESLYWTDLVIRADAPAGSLEDTFGGRVAWTVQDSHSGCNAPRHTLLPFFLERGGPLYARSVGPVVTPRASIEAVISGEVDVGPVDSYFHLLLKRFEPEIAARLKTVARTDRAPMPPLVAVHDLDAGSVTALRSALIEAHRSPIAKGLLDELAIREFVVPEVESYALAERWHEQAIAAGYPLPT